MTASLSEAARHRIAQIDMQQAWSSDAAQRPEVDRDTAIHTVLQDPMSLAEMPPELWVWREITEKNPNVPVDYPWFGMTWVWNEVTSGSDGNLYYSGPEAGGHIVALHEHRDIAERLARVTTDSEARDFVAKYGMPTSNTGMPTQLILDHARSLAIALELLKALQEDEKDWANTGTAPFSEEVLDPFRQGRDYELPVAQGSDVPWSCGALIAAASEEPASLARAYIASLLDANIARLERRVFAPREHATLTDFRSSVLVHDPIEAAYPALLDTAERRSPLDRCKNDTCGGLFAKYDRRMRYCSTTCADAQRQREGRRRKRLEKRHA